MNDRISRRGAIASTAVGAASLAAATCAEAAASRDSHPESHGFAKARRAADGFMELALRIVAADDFSPVKGVGVELVHVGVGADGGFVTQTTDDLGIVRFGKGSVGPGPFQIYLNPPAGTRYCWTRFTDIENMLTVQADGTCFPTQFRIAVRETLWREMRDHVHKPR